MSGISGVTEILLSPNISLELNSQVPLPHNWEQILDLEAGEVYYVNRENGRKTRRDPRKTRRIGGDYYPEEDEYDSDGGSASTASSSSRAINGSKSDQMLVVAGCKTCFMYMMVPRLAVGCPKCNSPLLHFG